MLKLELHTNTATRLDSLILESLRGYASTFSRRILKQWFTQGRIKNAESDRPLDPSHKIAPPGCWVRIEGVTEADLHDLTQAQGAKECFLPILFEDENLLILNKSSGTPSLPLSGSETGTAVSAALARAPQLASLSSLAPHLGPCPPLEPGLLHRLDTGTSGVLAFAKTAQEFVRLREAWKSSEKIYRAIVCPKSPHPLPEAINTPLAHSRHSSKRMIAFEAEKMRASEIRGKPLPAITLIRDTRICKSAPEIRLLDLTIEIKTGVFHQIRCHLSANGAPILGDPIYGKTSSTRLWLHAWKLTLPSANGKAPLLIEAPLPEDWPN